MQNLTLSNRLDYLDALRAFALLLGVVFHAGLSFMPVFIGWAVMDVNTSSMVGVFSLISHAFRMPLFFLLAGFFTHLSLQKSGARALLKSRAIRLGGPFIVGWLVLKPLLVAGWILGAQSMRGDIDLGSAVWQGITTVLTTPAAVFTGTHLWFLYYLLIFIAAGVAVHVVAHRLNLHREHKFKLLNRALLWFGNARMAVLGLMVATAFGLWFMQHWGLDTPDKSLLPHLPVTFIYGSFFVAGWWLNKNEALLAGFSRITADKIVLCVVSIAGACYFSAFETQPGHTDYQLIKVAFMVCYAGMMWSLVMLLMGISSKLFYRPSRVVRYIADRAYWLYLVHLPVVVWLQVFCAEIPVYWWLKLLTIVLITVVLSFAIFDFWLSNTWLGKLVTGAGNRPGKSRRPAAI